MEKLIAIREELSVPKDQKNEFGGFNYRSAEGILLAAGPLLKKHNCFLTIFDEVVEVGGRVYVKAAIVIKDMESGEKELTHGYAREPESKKGMDASQITGSASSYARKRALEALFLIDDAKKDPDSMDNTKSEKKAPSNAKKQQKQEKIMPDGVQAMRKELLSYHEKKWLKEIEINEFKVAIDCEDWESASVNYNVIISRLKSEGLI